MTALDVLVLRPLRQHKATCSPRTPKRMFILDILSKSTFAVAAFEAAQAPLIGSNVINSLLSWTTESTTSNYGTPGRKVCELHASGHERDDSSNFLKAVDECGKGGVIYMPDSN